MASQILPVVGQALGGPAGANIGQSIGSFLNPNQFNAVNKVQGVPTPGSLATGLYQGQQTLDYMNTAFPGTTPWERLGVSSPTGALAGQLIQTQSQQEIADKQRETELLMQERELATRTNIQMMDLANRTKIAERNNRVTAMGYGSPMGVEAARSMLEMRDGAVW